MCDSSKKCGGDLHLRLYISVKNDTEGLKRFFPQPPTVSSYTSHISLKYVLLTIKGMTAVKLAPLLLIK